MGIRYIFMYDHYERTTLRGVKNILSQSSELDKNELIKFIDTLVSRDSPRYMVDPEISGRVLLLGSYEGA